MSDPSPDTSDHRPGSRPTDAAMVRHFQSVAAFPQMAVGGDNIREMIDFVNESGLGSVGTVDDAVAQIERLMKQSNAASGATSCSPTSGRTRTRPAEATS